MKKRPPLILFFFLTICIGFPLFLTLSKGGIQDWDYALGHGALEQITILKYRQIPLWNPYYCGGMSNIGNTQADFLSPFYLPVLLLGPVVGYKIVFLLYVFFGLVGFSLLGAFLGMSVYAQILMGTVYLGSGLFIIPYAGGMTMYLALALLPYVFYWYFRTIQKRYSTFPIISLFLTLMFFWGFHYILVVLLFLGIFGGIWSIVTRRLKPIIVSILAIGLFFGFAAVKVFPTFQIGTEYKRVVNEKLSGYTIESLLYSLTSRNQTDETFYEIPDSKISFFKGRTYTFAENGMYVGFAVIILFILGFTVKIRKTLPLGITFIILLWLIFGFNITPSLYTLVTQLPIFTMMRVAQRYRYLAMVIAVIFGGFGFDVLLGVLKKYTNVKISSLSAYIVLGFITVDIVLVNSSLLFKDFILTHPSIPSVKEFQQSCNNGMYYGLSGYTPYIETSSSAWQNVYPYILANQGIVRLCNEPLPIKSDGVMCSTDPQYKGEVYLDADGSDVKTLSWSPNYLKYYVHAKTSTTIHINQNFDAGWHGKVDSISAPVLPSDTDHLTIAVTGGDHIIELYYLPQPFMIGVIISIFSFLGWITYIVYEKYSNVFSYIAHSQRR